MIINMELILQIFLIVTGVGIIIRVLVALAGRKMVEVYSVSWTLLAIFLILTGVLIRPVLLEKYIGWPFFWVMLIFMGIAIEGMFRITEHLSEFLRKSTELEMQISLLNDENYQLKKKLERKVRENEVDKKEETAVCDQYTGTGRRRTGTSAPSGQD